MKNNIEKINSILEWLNEPDRGDIEMAKKELKELLKNSFTKEQMEESFNDGIACQKQRAGYFDIDNYK